jgi:methylphosphonate synthase
MISPVKFQKILNDIKRRPEDAALDLEISKKEIDEYLKGEKIIPFSLISKAVDIWSINYSEFFDIEDDAHNGYKKMSRKESDNSKRIMTRGGRPYYLYKDTAYSRLSPFKPEWIEELIVVDDNDPENKQVVFNNGHFLHQFTYFIGDVNFYYILNGKKKVSVMSTGDSMYISPYVPHSFTSRKNTTKTNGVILALTYSDKLNHESIDELSAIGKDLSMKFKLDLENKLQSFKSNLNYYLKVSSFNLEELSKRANDENMQNIFSVNEIPSFEIINKIADALNINLRDLMPICDEDQVKTLKYSNCKKWDYPSVNEALYTIVELAGVKKLPISRALELHVNKDENISSNNSIIETPLHQYIYNIGKIKCNIVFENKKIELEPDDSVYVNPTLSHSFNGVGSKLLILITGGKISGDALYHFSMINQKELSRAIDDNKPWFDQ